MNVLMISPGFPAEMQLFTRGLASVGARVLGLGDQPRQALSEDVERSLSAYLQVGDLWDEGRVSDQVRRWLEGHSIDRVECLWEPGMLLAARLRQELGAPGLSVEETVPFRDKESMKLKLDAAGLRTPRHARARTESECRAAAERIGYPLIIKPIAGAGSADTFPLREPADLEAALQRLKHVPEVSVEEFIDGEEYTYDTVCAEGKVLFENIAWYRPKPLVMRLNEWISPQATVMRDLDAPEIAIGRELGRNVLRALGFRTGFTHMEWFRTPGGEAVFGEIGARPPGGRLVHGMNYSCDIDLFSGWAETVCYGRLSQDTTKKYNTVVVFKRAQGEGRIQRIEGLEHLLDNYGEFIPAIELTPLGAPKRDYRKVIVGDGWVVGRHPDLDEAMRIGNAICNDLRLYAS
jgi:hypothetical protein